MLRTLVGFLSHFRLGRFGSPAASLLLALATSFGCAACAGAPRAPAAPRLEEVRWKTPVTLSALERISAQVSLLGVHAGEFDFEVAPSCDDAADRIELRSRMSTAGVVRFFRATDGSSHTTMSLLAARPVTSDLLVIDGDVTRRYRARHRPGGAETIYERSGQVAKRKLERIRSGETPLDMQSAFMLLRHWQAPPGARGYFYVLLGKDLWRVTVKNRGTQLLSYHGESKRTVLVTGTATKLEPGDGKRATRNFSIWLTDDSARVPLKIDGDASFGTVHMELSARYIEPSLVCATASR